MSDFGVSFGANWLSYSGGSRKERETVERRGRERQSKGEEERFERFKWSGITVVFSPDVRLSEMCNVIL